MFSQALYTSIAWYSSISSDRALIFSICRNALFLYPLSRIYDCLFLYRHSQNKNTTAKRLFYIFPPFVPHNKAKKSPEQVLPDTYIRVNPSHQLHKSKDFSLWKREGYILKIYTFVPLWKEIQQRLIPISFYGKSRPRTISSPSNVYLSYIILLFAYILNVLSLIGKREKISYRKFFPPFGKIVNAS